MRILTFAVSERDAAKVAIELIIPSDRCGSHLGLARRMAIPTQGGRSEGNSIDRRLPLSKAVLHQVAGATFLIDLNDRLNVREVGDVSHPFCNMLACQCCVQRRQTRKAKQHTNFARQVALRLAHERLTDLPYTTCTVACEVGMNIRAEVLGGPEARKARLLVGKKPKQTESTALKDVIIPRDEPRRTDMRREDRPPLSGESFRVDFRGRLVDARIVNLSGGGAMIEAGFEPNIGERIDLHLAQDEVIQCLVRWIKNGRIGIEFAHETQLDCSDEKRHQILQTAVSRIADELAEDTRAAADTSEGRIADRHPLIWLGELRYRSRRWSVRLRNISATGVMVQCSRSLRVGWSVVLDLGDGDELSATVAWAVGDHAGLKFAEPFDLDRLPDCKPSVTPPTWVRPAYLESDVSAESAWDGPWNRMSLGELRAQLEGFLKR